MKIVEFKCDCCKKRIVGTGFFRFEYTKVNVFTMLSENYVESLDICKSCYKKIKNGRCGGEL